MKPHLIVLDVGCGSRPWGSINLDLNLGISEHHQFNYDPRKISNFTQGDGAKLPYRDKSVNVIVARHVLEHIPEPLEALREWARVASDRVIIMVPNNPTNEEFRAHLYSWSQVSLKNFLGLVFPRVEVYPNSHLAALYQNRVINKILRPGGFKKPLNRFIGSVMGFQLTAICYVN